VIARILRALIVDDEPVARRVLREDLDLQPDVEVVAEAATGREALDIIAAHEPDVVFLDLQMPEMGGFEVIQNLQSGSHLPVVIVVTAFDQHAIKAFEAGAIDYILKPIGQARLERSLERARQLIDSRLDTAENLAKLQEVSHSLPARRIRKVVGRVGGEYYLLNTAEVLAFQADGECVWIITAKQRYLATKSLRKIEEKLQGSTFRRVHRNALVNVDHVSKMASLSSNRWLMTLNNDQEFVVSKRLARNVRQILRGYKLNRVNGHRKDHTKETRWLSTSNSSTSYWRTTRSQRTS